MNRVFCIALTLIVIVPLSEGGFIKKAVTGIKRGKDTPNNHAQNYVGTEEEDAWKHHGEPVHGNGTQPYKNTSWHTENPSQNSNGPHKQSPNKGSTHRPGTQGSADRPTGPNQGYKNTTAHIIDEDYLTSTENETLQHQMRPTSQYGGGGSYNKKPSASGPYKNTTAHITDEDYLTSTENETLQHQQRPTSQYGGGGSYNKKPDTQTSQQGRITQAPSYHHQQGPNTQIPSFQNQHRPSSQTPSYPNQHRLSSQTPSYPNQHRPNTQMPSFQNQHTPNPQMPSYHHQQRPNPQMPSFHHQQRPSTGYDGNRNLYKRYATFHKNQSKGFGGGSSYSNSGKQRNVHGHTSYKNTTAHIIDQDYLTPNNTESAQHWQRPTSQYGGGGSYKKRDTTAQIAFKDESTPNGEVNPQPKKQFLITNPFTHSRIANVTETGTRVISKIMEALSPIASQNKTNSPPEDTSKRPETGKYSVPGEQIPKNTTVAEEPTPTVPTVTPTEKLEEKTVEHCVTLKSDSITCIYSNIREVEIENRRMRCNETDCKLEKNSEKSSLWICNQIKCTVANVDFSQDHGKKKLMECTMDERSIIVVQDKPVKCGPDEKEHNGRCRKVFGA